MYSKADTHIHTTCSDGLTSPEETVDIVSSRSQLRVIAITDHGTAKGAFAARAYAIRSGSPVEVIIGQEIYTGDGDVVGLFLKSSLPSFYTAAEAIAAIHAQGGLAVAVHPFSRWSTLNNMKGVGTKIFSLPFDAVEVRNGFPTNILANPLCAWLNRSQGQKLPEMGGSDSHTAYTAGQSFTWFPGRTAADLRRAIENGTIRAGGALWTPLNAARLVQGVIKRGGVPRYEHVYSD
jgi:predicted metal-dependent phosphoesterase TrpH